MTVAATDGLGVEKFTTARDPLRIALVAPPMKAIPPDGYGGTERVVATLANRRLIGAPDSTAVVASRPPGGVLAGFAATSGSGNANGHGNSSHSSPTGAGSR